METMTEITDTTFVTLEVGNGFLDDHEDRALMLANSDGLGLEPSNG